MYSTHFWNRPRGTPEMTRSGQQERDPRLFGPKIATEIGQEIQGPLYSHQEDWLCLPSSGTWENWIQKKSVMCEECNKVQFCMSAPGLLGKFSETMMLSHTNHPLPWLEVPKEVLEIRMLDKLRYRRVGNSTGHMAAPYPPEEDWSEIVMFYVTTADYIHEALNTFLLIKCSSI